MREIEQNEAIVSGFCGLDSEHARQIELLTAFRHAVAKERPRIEVDEIFDRLIDYTQVHFGAEQELMRLYQYPSYHQHREDHANTVDRLQALRRAYLDGKEELACSTADDLAEKLLAHMRSADRALGSFLVRLGVG